MTAHPLATLSCATPTRDEAMASFGAAFAAARRRRDEAYAAGGAQAVAQAAHVPGGPSIGELTEGYERLAQEARTQHSGTAA